MKERIGRGILHRSRYPPLTLEQIRLIPVHTRKQFFSAEWSRVACHIYWLSDGWRDTATIARLLHKAETLVHVHVTILAHTGHISIQPTRKVLHMNIDLLEESFTAVSRYGDRFAVSFYDTLFSMTPETKSFFVHTDMRRQAGSLMATLAAVIAGVKRGENLLPVLHSLGEKHAHRYQVKEEHYPLVGAALLATFAQYLGDAFTPAHREAWSGAFSIISSHMIDYEGRNT